MNKAEENYIEHEVRIRVVEEVHKDIKISLNNIETKMDSQFKWILATVLSLFGGIILHMAKLL